MEEELKCGYITHQGKRIFIPGCMGGAVYGLSGCTCKHPRKKRPTLSRVPTSFLVEELARREGVVVHIVEPYQKYKIKIGADQVIDLGPARIIVVND